MVFNMSGINNEKQNSKFIITFNTATAEMLEHIGFNFVSKLQNGYYIFLNESKKIMFEKLDDIAFTNKLFF